MSFSHRDDSDIPFELGLSSYNANTKIMLSTVLSFSIIIFIIFAYYLYARSVLRHPRSANQLFISQPPKRGLDSLAIASLPTFVVGVNDVDVLAMECAVCLSLLEEKDMVRMLPDCKHVFHVSCVDTWLITCSTCPLCRADVEPRPRLEPEPREGVVGDGVRPLDLVEASRLDSFQRVLTRERSLSNNHSCVDQDRVMDLERQ